MLRGFIKSFFFAKQNRAEVGPRFQCLVKLLLGTKCVEWVKVHNVCGLLCLYVCMYVCIHVLLEFCFLTRCHLPNLIILYPRWWTLPKICRYIGTWEPAFKPLSGPWLVVLIVVIAARCKYSWCFFWDRSWWLNLHFIKVLLKYSTLAFKG